jgi:hypothetical protein
MDVIGFLCVSLGNSTVQLHDSHVATVHAHVQRLVSVVKMATVLEGVLPKSKVLLCLFCGQNDLMQRTFIEKYSLFRVESVCRVKRLTSVSRNSLKDVRK